VGRRKVVEIIPEQLKWSKPAFVGGKRLNLRKTKDSPKSRESLDAPKPQEEAPEPWGRGLSAEIQEDPSQAEAGLGEKRRGHKKAPESPAANEAVRPVVVKRRPRKTALEAQAAREGGSGDAEAPGAPGTGADAKAGGHGPEKGSRKPQGLSGAASEKTEPPLKKAARKGFQEDSGELPAGGPQERGRKGAPYVGRFGADPLGLDDAARKKALAEKRKKQQQLKKKKEEASKAPAELPKRVRRILTFRNPELLRKAAEWRAKKAAQAGIPPEEAEGVEGASSGKAAAKRPKKSKAQKPRLSRKSRRILNRYGLVSSVLADKKTTKKILSYRMLFSEPPIQEMTDDAIADNARLLFMAYSDHKFPECYEKFVTFLKKNMCSGIPDEQLERLIRISKAKNFITVQKDGIVKVNVEVGMNPSQARHA
jgi:hypothetical protein